ncbi:MAG: hypothetical protein Q9160_000030 [Pyrenula sp. 1 TL-2023]
MAPSPSPLSPSSPPATRPKTLYIGRFIHTPTPTDLGIHERGAALVDNEAGGVIVKLAWEEQEVEDLISGLLFGDAWGEEVEVVRLQGGNENDKETEELGFWFPGFVDTHIHAPQYPNVGLFGSSTLLSWLETYTFPLESSFGSPNTPFRPSPTNPSDLDPQPDPLTHASNIYSRLLHRKLSHGTTTASYFATIHAPATNLLASLAFSSGQRALIGRVCMDDPRTCPSYYRDSSTDETISRSREVISHIRSLDPTGSLVRPILTPRFGLSCLPSTFSALGQLAQAENLPIQTHISENLDEVRLVSELHPNLHNDDSTNPSSPNTSGLPPPGSQPSKPPPTTYAALYDHHSLLTPRTILAHAIHLSPTEIQLISARHSKISHCPASNTAIGSGLCPVRKLRDAGIEVGLGTDVSGGWSVGMLESVRMCVLVGRMVACRERERLEEKGEREGEKGVRGKEEADRNVIPVTEALYLATKGGANVVGMGTDLSPIPSSSSPTQQQPPPVKIGDFTIGAKWDVQEISLSPKTDSRVDIWPWETGWRDRVEKWVWNGDERNVRRVWVGGRLVFERK